MHSPAAAAVEADYDARLAGWRAERDARERTHRMVGSVRVALAVAAIVLVIALRFDAAPWLGLIAVAFVAAVVWHARVISARDRARRAVAWYEQGGRRIRHEWIGHGDQGDRFRPDDHLYAADLDLFGHASLFQLQQDGF